MHLLDKNMACCLMAWLTLLAAAWLTKHGHLLSRLDLCMRQGSFNYPTQHHHQHVAAAELGIAASLRAAAAGNHPHNLQISSCKLSGAGPDSAAILQALPGSTLTSLEYHTALPWLSNEALADDFGRALAGLQQLRQLNMSSRDTWHMFGATLRGFGTALTSLTRLSMPLVSNQFGQLVICHSSHGCITCRLCLGVCSTAWLYRRRHLLGS
jgi:hypothetical protein